MQNRRVAVRGIIFQDNKLLCCRLKQYAGKLDDEGKSYWCTPGGGAEIGEPLEAVVERELVEELGIKPVIGALLYIQQFQHQGWEHLEFFFNVTNSKDYKQINLTATSHGAVEIAEAGFVDVKSVVIKPDFLQERDIAADIRAGTTTIFDNFDQ